MPARAPLFLAAAAAAALLAASLHADAAGADRRRRPPVRGARIIDGHPAGMGQFKHQALIVADNRFTCGGSLIKTTVVLTIGWCVKGYKEFTIKLGGIHLNKSEDTTWTVKSIWGIVHPQYNTGTYYSNDVAVILLPRAAPLTSWIQPVALPSLNKTCDSYVGRTALISGWGRIGGSGPLSETLRFAEVTIISNKLCEKFYSKDIIESTLCAGNNYTAFCHADHGGALVLETGGGYMQVGIASFTKWGCENTRPGAYARVTSYLSWIEEVAGNLHQ